MHKRGRGNTIFCRFFCFTVPKHFVDDNPSVSESFVYRKNLCIRVGCHNSPSVFLSHSTETFRRGTLLCFRKISVSENVEDETGGGKREGISRLFFEIFLPNKTKIFRRGALLCFKTFPLSKNFIEKRGISQLSVGSFFISKYRKTLKGNPSVFQKNSGIQNFHA